MTYSVTVDVGTFNEDLPTDLKKRIFNYYRSNHCDPRYILLGYKEIRYLRMEFTQTDYAIVFKTDSTARQTFHGIEILPVALESFVDVVG